MLFKYPFVLEGIQKEFSSIEDTFMDQLSDFDFIDDLDYDGQCITIFVSEANKEIANQNALKLQGEVHAIIESYC